MLICRWGFIVHTRRLNYRTDKSYQQTILTAYRRNFHYLFEFSDILPIFAKKLFFGTHIYLSQPCRWCSMVGLYFRISYTYHIALHHHFWWCGAFLFC
nr:MAG TPA: hypothetical protein [Caudoviricetes sp.]